MLTTESSSFRKVVTAQLAKKVLILHGCDISLTLSEGAATGFYLEPQNFSPQLLAPTVGASNCSAVLACQMSDQHSAQFPFLKPSMLVLVYLFLQTLAIRSPYIKQ
jgi:hypothetical protein